MAVKLEKTRDEQEQDELLARFGLADGTNAGAPTVEGGSAEGEGAGAGEDLAKDPSLAGEGADPGAEGGEDLGADGAAKPEGAEDAKPPLKGWEKRAADNQHNYHLERNAREKVEKVALELKAELDRQRSAFAELMERVSKAEQAPVKSKEPDQEDALDQDYPEISSGVKEKLSPLQKKIEVLEAKIAQTESKTAVDLFLDKVASPEGGNVPQIRQIIADRDFNEWLDKTGGYAERVMRHTFSKDFNFNEKDVAEVVARYQQATGKQPAPAGRQAERPAAPERPRVPSGSGGLKGVGPADVFTEEEMGNLRALADQAGRAFSKGFDKDALTKFDDKLTRSINYYDKNKS